MHRFADKTVLVTGAANGQGAAEVRLLVAEGAHVMLGDRDEVGARALCSELGPKARALRMDVAQEADWAAAMQEIMVWRGRLDGLVNNAGVYDPKPLLDTEPADFLRHVEVNQVGCYLGMRAAAKVMAADDGGSIVNIGSSAGLRGSPNSFAYCATKWALRGMTKSAAASLAASGIRVNAVHPGPIETGMLQARSEAANEQRRKAVPLGRFGEAREVARIVLFLLSDDSAYMTGADITVDGGVSL